MFRPQPAADAFLESPMIIQFGVVDDNPAGCALSQEFFDLPIMAWRQRDESCTRVIRRSQLLGGNSPTVWTVDCEPFRRQTYGRAIEPSDAQITRPPTDREYDDEGKGGRRRRPKSSEARNVSTLTPICDPDAQSAPAERGQPDDRQPWSQRMAAADISRSPHQKYQKPAIEHDWQPKNRLPP